MKFYGRNTELEALKNVVTKRPNLILIRGRRRVGKTTLILQLLKEVSGVYLYIDQKKNEKALLTEFEEILRKELNLPEYVKIEKWEDLYNIIFSHDKLVVFDEFQRLIDVNLSAINQLQNYWDRKGLESKAALILSGSNVGMLKKIFLVDGAPLFKRVQYDLVLKPFTFFESREILENLGIIKIDEQIRVYSIIGGIPYYYRLLEGNEIKTWREVVKILFLNSLSPLKNEARDILVESFGKDHPSYYAVINAIAIGKTTKKEIADFSGIKETSISPYLYDLEGLVDIIEYNIPVTEKKTWKSRRGIFTLKDNLFRFWFRYIFRNISYYEEENYEELMNIINDDFENYMGKSFEYVAEEFLGKLNKKRMLPEVFPKIGEWWDRKGNEIDIVGISDNGLLLVECKWGTEINASSIFNELIEKEKLVPVNKKNKYYVIVARGFKSKTEKAMCSDIEDISKMG